MNKSSWNGTLPSTATEVVNLQNSALSLYKKEEFSNNLFQDTILRLMSLRDQIRSAEMRFYKAFNLPEGSNGLRVLQQRFDELNSDYGFRSMSNLSDSYFDELVASAMNKIDLTKPVNAFFSNDDIQRQFLESHFVNEEINDNLNGFISALNQFNLTGGQRIYRSASGARGLSKYIGKVLVDPKKGKDGIQIEFSQSLPSSWQSRLKNDYGLIINNENLDRAKILENWLKSNISNPQINSRVMYQFQKKRNQYDLNSSSASIKGFLGEIRTAAFLDHLCGRNGSTIPIGGVHELINGQSGGEIAIDLLLKGFGFQVKNYRINNGKTTFAHRDSMGMGTFIVDRMRPEAGISQLLQEFFGSWAFNKPIDDATERYEQIYSRFANNNLTEVFEGYVDNIIKISDEFQADMKYFSKMNLYFNTFFFIGDKIVPSSSILTAIIHSLSAADTDKLITSSFQIAAPSGGESWSYESPQPSSSVETLANLTKISWFITLDLSRILEEAYSQII